MVSEVQRLNLRRSEKAVLMDSADHREVSLGKALPEPLEPTSAQVCAHRINPR